jgi:pyruvate dehydrogenase (quinone)
MGAAWDRALAADRPVVIEAMVDGDISLLPPHITFEQASAFAKALVKGDPDEGSIIAKSVKGVIAGVFPGREQQKT